MSPLDNPIWSALTTRHSPLSEGDARARRYPADLAPFGAVAEPSGACLQAMARLVPPAGRVAMFTAGLLPDEAALTKHVETKIEQMVATELPSEVEAATVRLGPADLGEMLALAELAKPGPFTRRSLELGGFVGVRAGPLLVAMAGERMQLDGHVEISAVCVHPDHRGRGHAKVLVTRVARAIAERGDTPFLHVFSPNASAIALYRRLGFVNRRQMHLTVLGLAGATVSGAGPH